MRGVATCLPPDCISGLYAISDITAERTSLTVIQVSESSVRAVHQERGSKEVPNQRGLRGDSDTDIGVSVFRVEAPDRLKYATRQLNAVVRRKVEGDH